MTMIGDHPHDKQELDKPNKNQVWLRQETGQGTELIIISQCHQQAHWFVEFLSDVGRAVWYKCMFIAVPLPTGCVHIWQSGV